MRYSVNLRMKNPGVAKFLIDTRDTNDLTAAFDVAAYIAETADRNHFVEIVDNNSNETVATFGGEA